MFSTALRLVKVGGTVVYSTCSMSPIQNDGVVHMALRKIWEETSIKIVVRYICVNINISAYIKIKTHDKQS